MFSASDVKDLRERTGAGMMDCKKALQESNGDMDKAIDWLREKGISKAAKKESRIAAEGLTETLVEGNTAVIVEVNSETDFVAKNQEFKSFIANLTKTILNGKPSTMEEAMALTMEDDTVNNKLIALIAKIGEKISFRRFQIIEKNDNQVFGVYNHQGLGKINIITVLDGNDEQLAKDVAMHTAAMRPQYFKRSDIPSEVIEREKEIAKEQLINSGLPEAKVEFALPGKLNKFYEEVCLEDQIYIKAEGKETVAKFVNANNSNIVEVVRYEVGEGIEKRHDDFASEVMSQING